MDEYSRKQKRAILSAIPSSSCMVRRRMLDEALTVVYGSKITFYIENYFNPAVTRLDGRNLNKFASLLERAFEIIDAINIRTIVSCEDDLRANEPKAIPIKLGNSYADDGDIYALRPTWKEAILTLPILARSAKRVSAGLDEMWQERKTSNNATGRRWRRQAVVDAIEMLADTWIQHLGVAPTLTYFDRDAKIGGNFFRFIEATLRPILPTYYNNRSLESAVRSAIYNKSCPDGT